MQWRGRLNEAGRLHVWHDDFDYEVSVPASPEMKALLTAYHDGLFLGDDQELHDTLWTLVKGVAADQRLVGPRTAPPPNT